MKLNSLKNMNVSTKLMRFTIVALLAILLLTIIISNVTVMKFKESASSVIYVLDDESQMTLRAKKGNTRDYLEPEIIGHTTRFIELFFAIDQYNYETRINKALDLADESAFKLYEYQKARGHYTKLVYQNTYQTIEITETPNIEKGKGFHRVIVKVIVNLHNEMGNKKTEIILSADVHKASRSEKNPHGLILKNIRVKSDNKNL